jgi:hypothetical protein
MTFAEVSNLLACGSLEEMRAVILRDERGRPEAAPSEDISGAREVQLILLLARRVARWQVNA